MRKREKPSHPTPAISPPPLCTSLPWDFTSINHFQVTLLIKQGSAGDSVFFYHVQRLVADFLDLGRTQGFSYDLTHVRKILELEILEDQENARIMRSGSSPATVSLHRRIEASMAILDSMSAEDARSDEVQIIVLPVPLQVLLHCNVWLAFDASLGESYVRFRRPSCVVYNHQKCVYPGFCVSCCTTIQHDCCASPFPPCMCRGFEMCSVASSHAATFLMRSGAHFSIRQSHHQPLRESPLIVAS